MWPLPQISTSRLRQGLALFAIWTAVALVFALPQMAQAAHWTGPLSTSLAQWWSWGLLTPVIVMMNRRLRHARGSLARRLPGQFVLGIATTVVYVHFYAVLDATFSGRPLPELRDGHLMQDALGGMFLWALIVYWLIVYIGASHENQRRALAAELSMERLERSFAQARLNALRLQLDPHFLFNALNTISAQLQTEPRLARRMIEHLGDLLRLSLDPKSRHEVSLSEELAFLDHYLAIQRIRFGAALNVELSISPEASEAAVPSLFMQPLVENAIRHGISRRANGGTVRIAAARRGDLLEILVTDDGMGLPRGWDIEKDAGIGLSVTRERILGLHAEAASRFTVCSPQHGGTEVQIAFAYSTMSDRAGNANA